MRGPRRRSIWNPPVPIRPKWSPIRSCRRRRATASASRCATLDARSRDILESRWLTDQKSTLHELAARYDVSAERIRQLEKNALKKLKNAMQETVIAA